MMAITAAAIAALTADPSPPLPHHAPVDPERLAKGIRHLALVGFGDAGGGEYRRFSRQRARALAHAMEAAARRHDVDVALLVGYAWFESRLRLAARGDRGRSLGLFQLGAAAVQTQIGRGALAWWRTHLHALPHWQADVAAGYLARLRDNYPACWMAVYGAGKCAIGSTRMGWRKVRLAVRLRRWLHGGV